MSLILKSMWRLVLRGTPLHTTTPRCLCLLSELPQSSKSFDTLMTSLKTAGHAEDVLSEVRVHLSQMTHTHMLQALRTLFVLHREGELRSDTDSLIRNPTFGLLCTNFKKHVRELQVNETIEATKALSYLKVPVESVLVQTLLQIIRCNINDLNIRHIMFLDFLLGRFDKQNHLVDALKLALPLAFQIRLPMELDDQDLPLLKDMLAYACTRDLPDRIVNNIVTALLLHDQTVDAKTAKSIIWSLCLINCTDSKFPTRVQLLHICYDILWVKIDSLTFDEVLKTAARIKGRILAKHPEYYQEQMMDAVAEYVIRNQVDFEKGLLIARVLSRIAHTHLGLITHLCNQAAANPETLSTARTNILFGFINCLSNNNYIPEEEQWTEIKRQLSLNPILDGKIHALPWAKLCLEMASLGLFQDKLLARVFSKDFLDDYLAREDNILDYLQLLTLHLAVKQFHSDKYELPKDIVKKAKEMYPVNRMNEQLEVYLAKGMGGSEYVVRNVALPCGINADLVTCIKNGHPVTQSIVSSDSKVELEKLNIPEGSLTLCIINFNAGCYSMNSNRLRGTFRLVLDILDNLGYLVAPVNINEWMSIPTHERTQYLMREVEFKCGEMGLKLTGT